MARPNKPLRPPGTPNGPPAPPRDDARAGRERGAGAAPGPPRPPPPPPPLRQAPGRGLPAGLSDRAQGTGPRGQAPGGELVRVRVLEHTGEHAQAAALRLEYAQTLCGTVQRIALLREGCARNPGASEEGRALHQALAETLLRHAEFMEDGAPRRAILMEAARALEEADQGAVAGEIYERLGMHRRAARAYERAGAINQLEYVLGLLERHEQIEQALQSALESVDAAMRGGQRLLAYSLLQEHLHDRRLGLGQGPAATARTGLVARLTALEAALPRAPRLSLRWSGGTTQLLLTAQLRIGRSPEVELPLTGTGLSREHVALRTIHLEAQALTIAALDLGSRAGSFWAGEPLEPGEPRPIDEPGELGLGFGASVTVHPLREPGLPGEDARGPVIGALLQARVQATAWTLFLPEGGPLRLDPQHALPVHVGLRPPFIALQLAPGVSAHLGSQPLGAGAGVELLIGDRLHLDLPAGRMTIEVGA